MTCLSPMRAFRNLAIAFVCGLVVDSYGEELECTASCWTAYPTRSVINIPDLMTLSSPSVPHLSTI